MWNASNCFEVIVLGFADVKIYAVYKDGIAFHRPCGMNYNPDEWVDSIFQVEIEQKLKKFILEV